jgi:2-keto-4-pentenoate hydratase
MRRGAERSAKARRWIERLPAAPSSVAEAHLIQDRVAAALGGDPAGFAVALVNTMRNTGGVKARQIVTTGSWTGLLFLKPGRSLFDPLRGAGRSGSEISGLTLDLAGAPLRRNGSGLCAEDRT